MGDEEGISLAVKYNTGLEEMIGVTDVSNVVRDTLMFVQAVVMKDKFKIGVSSCSCFGGTSLTVLLL